LAAGFWADGDFGAVEGGVDEVEDFGIVEDGGWNEADVADEVATAFQAAIGIGEAGALEEAQGDVVGHKENGKNCERGFVVGAEADYEAVVIVVDHFDGAWQTLAHFGESAAGLGGDFWGIFGEEAGELLRWSGGRGIFGGMITLMRSCGGIEDLNAFTAEGSFGPWAEVVEANQVNVFALAVLGDFEQIEDAEKSGGAGELGSDVGKADRLDRIDFDCAFLHAVLGAYFDVRARPDADATGDFAAADAVAKTLGECHGEILASQKGAKKETAISN